MLSRIASPFLICLFSILGMGALQAQEEVRSQVRGSFQMDAQYLFPDSIIGADAVDERFLSNSFLQVTYQRGKFSGGIRYEAYLNPLLGFDPRYKGQGIPYRFARYQGDKLDITVGNFYDQIGNGMLFRAYQEWALGIDNSIDGVRLQYQPRPGIRIKGMVGTQRIFWDQSTGLLRGGDIELTLNQLIKGWEENKTRITLGAGAFNRFEEDTDFQLQLPENVSAMDIRAQIARGGFVLDAEYAYKINDPFQLNNYVYNPGSALYLGTVYSRKGLGITLSAKRIDNFDFRSQRAVTLQEGSLSFLPPLSRLHTYRLPTLYPYATQLNGEVGIQGTIIYTVPKKTRIGGKYGTKILLNFSRMHGLDTVFTEPKFRYTTTFLGDIQNLYFQDINITLNRKWNKKFRTLLTYINLRYNKDIIELGLDTDGEGMVNTQIAVLEMQYKISRKVALRTEVQYMGTKEDLGSWAMALAELSISPNWYFTLFDEWNYGNPNPDRRVHYYNSQVAYAFGGNRLAVGYSRQRRGLLCVGGICREVPASNGFSLAVSSTF